MKLKLREEVASEYSDYLQFMYIIRKFHEN